MKRFLTAHILVISALIIVTCDKQPISSGFPSVITLSAEDRDSSVVFSGVIKNESACNIDEIGFIWQNSDDPFSKPGFMVKSEKSKSGDFNAEISWSLTNDKYYTLRAYARCGDKTVYGEKLSFKTALVLPCKLTRVEPGSAFRGDTIKIIGKGFNQTLKYNQVFIDGKSTVVTSVDDSILTCIVPVELTRGLKNLKIVVNGISGIFNQKFNLLLPPPPQVVTKAAQNILWSTATLEGSVNPHGLPGTAAFEYGLSSSYGLSKNAVPSSVTGDGATDVDATISNLQPNSVYHYRIRAFSESGTGYGEDMTFTTLEVPPAPVIRSLSATTIKYGNTLTVYGSNLDYISSVVIGSATRSIAVTPKNRTSESIDIEIYNQENPSQLLGVGYFRVGLVHYYGTVWSEPVTIVTGWTKLADLPSSARYKAGCFSVNGKIYVGCGAENGSVKNDFWEYNPSTGLWTRMADFPGIPRVYAMGSSSSTSGYMGAGLSADNSSKYQLYDFYKYDPLTNTWSSIPAFPDQINNFFFNYSASINGRPFFGLSNVANVCREIVNDSWVSHPSVTDLMDSPANGVLTIGNSIYIISGFRTNSAENKSVWEYNTLNDTWTRKRDFPGTPRHSAVFFSIGNYGYFGCGRSFNSEQYKDMWRYDPENDSWIRIEDFPAGPRSHTVNASSGNYGYTGFGVVLSSVRYFKDFWQYNPE